MTSTALPRLIRKSPLAIAACVLLTFFAAAVEVPHAVPTMDAPVVAA